MVKQSNYILTHSRELSRKYAGKHIALVDNEIVAVGKNRLQVYKKAIKGIPRNKKVGIYYLPSKDEILTAL
jgi:hypothetical protein